MFNYCSIEEFKTFLEFDFFCKKMGFVISRDGSTYLENLFYKRTFFRIGEKNQFNFALFLINPLQCSNQKNQLEWCFIEFVTYLDDFLTIKKNSKIK